MLETVMLIAAGFLAASLLALLMVPVLWQRARRLTELRIRSQTPLSVAEIQADKDRLRAEYALEIRRLEKSVDAMRADLVSAQAEATRKTEIAQSRSGEAMSATRNLGEVSRENEQLREKLLRAETEARTHLRSLKTANERLIEQSGELQALRSMAHEAGVRVNEQTVEIAALKTVIATDQERRRNAEDAMQRAGGEGVAGLGSISRAAREKAFAVAGGGEDPATAEPGQAAPAATADEARLGKELELAREELSSRIHEVESLKARIGDLGNELDELRKKLRGRDKERASASRSAVALGARLEELRRDLEQKNLGRRAIAAELRTRIADITAMVIHAAASGDNGKAILDRLKSEPVEEKAPLKTRRWGRKVAPDPTLMERIRAFAPASETRP